MSTIAAAPRVASRDVEDVLRAGGFTPFHRRAVFITGIAWSFVAMEILLVGFILPVFAAEWNLSGRWQGWIAASALAGSLVGSSSWAPGPTASAGGGSSSCRSSGTRPSRR